MGWTVVWTVRWDIPLAAVVSVVEPPVEAAVVVGLDGGVGRWGWTVGLDGRLGWRLVGW
jgi:hypothetical protein